jgi:hypothetical protein
MSITFSMKFIITTNDADMCLLLVDQQLLPKPSTRIADLRQGGIQRPISVRRRDELVLFFFAVAKMKKANVRTTLWVRATCKKTRTTEYSLIRRVMQFRNVNKNFNENCHFY